MEVSKEKAALIALLFAVACGGDPETGETATTTGVTDSASTTSGTQKPANLSISWEFSGFPNGERRCEELGFETLWLEISIDGDLLPIDSYPCDDTTIELGDVWLGSWRMTLRTTEELASESEPQGVSDEFMQMVSAGAELAPHLVLKCTNPDGSSC